VLKEVDLETAKIRGTSGSWSHTILFSVLHSIKEWPRRPSEFGICPPEEDLLWMLAHDQTFAKMQAYESMLTAEEMKKNASTRSNRNKRVLGQ
jgi:hypothetical protein